MYKHILVTLEATPTDRTVIDHIKKLATELGSDVSLIHVATGVPALWHGKAAVGKEVEEDQKYLDQVQAEFQAAGVAAKSELAFGDPVKEIVKCVNQNAFDLIAMSTHGHKMVADLLLGATASRVQHSVTVPVLMMRAKVNP